MVTDFSPSEINYQNTQNRSSAAPAETGFVIRNAGAINRRLKHAGRGRDQPGGNNGAWLKPVLPPASIFLPDSE